MASLKESFAKSLTTINVKTNNFMEENKCKTYISTLEEEIKNLKYKIGENLYNNRDRVDEVKAEIDGIMNEISGKYEEIHLQEEKIRKLAEEEQQILGTGTAEGKNTEVTYCSQCGMQNSVLYKFCCKCGKPLQE